MNRWLLIGIATGALACSVFGATDKGGGGPADADAGKRDGEGPPLGAAQDLATGQHTPTDIVVDATSVYWLNRPSAGKKGEIVKAPKSGGSVDVLMRDLVNPFGMTSDATSLFVADNDVGGVAPYGYVYQDIYRQDKGGGEGQPVKLQLTANDTLFGCAVHGRSVFYALQRGGGTVGVVDTDPWGKSPGADMVGNLGTIKAISADPNHVYAGGESQIFIVDRPAGPANLFAKTNGAVTAILLDPASSLVYWADASSIRSLDKTAPAGTTPTDLATDEDGPTSIAVDAANVYWTNYGGGTIRAVPKAGGTPTTLASGEREPYGIAVDDSGLYWTNHGDGRVRMMRR